MFTSLSLSCSSAAFPHFSAPLSPPLLSLSCSSSPLPLSWSLLSLVVVAAGGGTDAAEVAGSKARLPESGRSGPEPPDVEGGAEAAGNCFYVSMLAGPPDSSTEPSQPDSLPAWQPWGSRGGRRRPSHSAPSLALRDVGSIFHTIEQLTVKLNRLKDVELAHRELLRSLAGESGGTTPVGSFHTEAAGWTDSSLSPPARETLASDSRDSHQPGPCSEDGSDTALEDGTALTASSPGL